MNDSLRIESPDKFSNLCQYLTSFTSVFILNGYFPNSVLMAKLLVNLDVFSTNLNNLV